MKEAKVEKLYRLAMSAYSVCSYEEAIVIFKSLLSHDFRHAYAHFYLAISYQKTQEYELSLGHFIICDSLGFAEVSLYKGMALSYRKIGFYREGNYYIQKHLKQSGEDHESYADMADNYLSLNQIDHAVSVMKQAIFQEPKIADYHIKLAKLYKQQRNFDAALMEIKKTLALDPHHWEAYFVCGSLYAAIDAHKEAVKFYKRSIEMNSAHAMSHNNMAVSYLKLEEPYKAYKSIEEALKYAQNNRNIQKNFHQIETICYRPIGA